MKKVRKAIVMILAAAIFMSMGMSLPAKASDTTDTVPELELKVPEDKVPTYKPGKAQDFVLNVTNKGTKAAENIVIEPNLQDSHDKWPFKTDYQSYSAKIDKLEPKDTAQVKFSFTQRDDIPAARYTLQFTYTADDGVSGSSAFYINTSAKEVKKEDKKDTKKEEKKNKTASSQAEPVMQGADAGGYSNGEVSFSDGDGGSGGGEGGGSVPRVIVTGFSTNPSEVKAGTDFTLTIHLKNTSKKSKVQNMLFDLNAPEEGADEQTTAPAFLPASGSSSIFLESMKANGTADISIKLNAKSDLLQKPYSVELSMKYEDKDYNAVETASSISIPVKQDARFEFSEFEINPESIAVGEESNVMCNLYNLGRIKLYNVKAVFEGDCIEREEVFVGNVESGATASIDAMLEGTKVSEGPGTIKMIVSYENEEGEVTLTEKEFQLEVAEQMEEDMSDVTTEEVKSFSMKPVIIGIILIIILVAAVIIFLKKKKRKQMLNEEEELLYELDGPSEDEQQ